MSLYWCHRCNWKSDPFPNGVCPKCKTERDFEIIEDGMCEWCNEEKSEVDSSICGECWEKTQRGNKRNIKAELLEALKTWTADDPKILRLFTTKGSYCAKKILVRAEEWIIITEGLAFRDEELFEIESPIPIEISKINDFTLKYEVGEDEQGNNWQLLEKLLRQKEKKAFEAMNYKRRQK